MAERYGPPPPPPEAAVDRDTLYLHVGGVAVSGWTSVRVTRGLERTPSDFALDVTERFPGAARDLVVTPGEPARVRIGPDTVLTGYVDRYEPSIASASHTVRVVGRGKCSDIVDCSIAFLGNQMNRVSLIDLARRLCEPYGVLVRGHANADKVLPFINFMLGETPYEIVERVSRWAKVVPYEDAAGDLVLDTVGRERHEGEFRSGRNVQAASVSLAMDRRYSEYVGYLFSSNSFADHAGALFKPAEIGNKQGTAEDKDAARLVRADGKPRYRRLVVISEQFEFGEGYLAKQRAEWEMNRRWGRGQSIRLTADTWRDAAGRLWEPNRLVRVHVPELKVQDREWVVSEVSYVKDLQSGTTAEITLMPPEAFAVEPVAVAGTYGDIQAELKRDLEAKQRDPKSDLFNPRLDEERGGA